MKYRNTLTPVLLCLGVVLTSVLHARQDEFAARLGEAKGLYESAEYDRALAAMDRIDSSAITPDQARDRALYQALCLLALDRRAEAEAKIEEVVQAQPLFRPEGDMPPRLRSLVDAVRVRLTPALVQQHYRAGKDRFDAEDYSGALNEFELVLQLTEGGGDRSGASMLPDVKTLALGFRDLSRAALSASNPTPVPTLGTAPASAPGRESAVVPPVPIRQNIPTWPQSLASRSGGPQPESLGGVIELVVNAKGDVESVKLLKRIHPVYDALLLAAARDWKYQPATRDGKPVEFVKRVAVNVTLR